MAFHFHIRPRGEVQQGFELTCDGLFPRGIHHARLHEAIIHAVQVGHTLPGDIQVYDCEGSLVETLPLRFATPFSTAPLVQEAA